MAMGWVMQPCQYPIPGFCDLTGKGVGYVLYPVATRSGKEKQMDTEHQRGKI